MLSNNLGKRKQFLLLLLGVVVLAISATVFAIRTIARRQDQISVEPVSTYPARIQERQAVNLDWSTLQATGLGITVPKDLGPSYKLTGLYGIKGEDDSIVSINATYTNADEKKLIMLQQVRLEPSLRVLVSKDRLIREVSFDETTAYLYYADGEGEGTKSKSDNMIGITWMRSDLHVSVTGNVSEDEMMRIAKFVYESIKLNP